MRHLPWIIAVLIAAAIFVIAYPVLQTQRQLWAVQSELNRANKQVVQAKLANSELEKVVAFLKTELDWAKSTHTELQGKLDQANRDIRQLRDRLASATSQLAETQSHAEQLTAELDKARSATDAAKAELAKREKQLGELSEQLASERKTS